MCRKSIIVCLSVTVVLAAAAPARAQRARDQVDPKFASLLREYEEAEKEFMRPYTEAKTPEERANVRLDYSQHPRTAYIAKFMELAEEYRGTDTAAWALAWVIQNGRSGGPEQQEMVRNAVKQLAMEHIGHDQIRAVLPFLVGARNVNAKAFLRKVISDSPDRDARGLACYYLARVLGENGLRTGKLTEKAEKQMVSLLNRARGEYGQVHVGSVSLADKADQLLFEINNLMIGKTAPDISGRDIDNTFFHLSDYRGKVVVLDFWGDW